MVASGLQVPEPGWIWSSVAPAEFTVDMVACGTTHGWSHRGTYSSSTSTTATSYGIIEADANYPRLRGFVAFTATVGPAGRPPDPSRPGTVYGQSEVVEASPCTPGALYPPAWGACYQGNLWAPIVVDSVFQGCD